MTSCPPRSGKRNKTVKALCFVESRDCIYPNGGCISQPRVIREADYPGLSSRDLTPKGFHRSVARLRCNPSGRPSRRGTLPRVAAPRQPRAVRCNAFGVRTFISRRKELRPSRLNFLVVQDLAFGHDFSKEPIAFANAPFHFVGRAHDKIERKR